jgi:hypothetical protein
LALSISPKNPCHCRMPSVRWVSGFKLKSIAEWMAHSSLKANHKDAKT